MTAMDEETAPFCTCTPLFIADGTGVPSQMSNLRGQCQDHPIASRDLTIREVSHYERQQRQK